jgi:hypothetical protein
MSKIDKCFADIRKMFAEEELSDQEIRSMVTDFKNIMDTSGAADFMAKANEYRKAIELREAAELKKKTITLVAVKDLKNKTISDLPEGVDRSKAIYERAQNVFTGGARASEGGNFSAQYIRTAYSRRMRGALEIAIKAEGMEKLVQDSDFSRQLRKEMFDNGSVQDPRIHRIAKKMQGIYEFQKNELIRLGVDMGEVVNYMGWQSYDKAKIVAAGKDAFITDMSKAIDPKKTFTDEFTPESQKKRLSEIYDSIVLGDEADPTRKRSVHYASGDATHDIMSKYGRYPSAVESMLSQIEYTSRRLALMQKFGPKYEDGFKNYKKWLEKTAPPPERAEIELIDGKHPTGLAGIEARAKQFGTTIENLPKEIARRAVSVDNLYLDVIGKTTSPSGSVWAQAGSTHRTLISLWNLGGAAISALFPDFASNAALVKSFDGKKGIGSGIADIFGTYTQTIFDRKQRAETMAIMGIYADDMIGGIANIHGELNEGAQPGMVSEAARSMFKWTGLTDHTQNIRAATAKVLGARLATHSERGFNELPELLRSNLKRYSIGEKEWNVIKEAKVTFQDGVVALSPEAIWDLPGKLFDKKLTKGELYVKYATAMNETTELGTLTGDAYTRTLFYQGMQDDSFWGQIGRYVAQFKQAPIQNMRLGARLYESADPDIVRRFGATGKYVGGMASVAPAFVYMTSMGLMSYYAKELLGFRTPPSPTDPATMKEAFVRGGGAGLLGDYFFAEYNKSYRSLTADLMGPAFGDADKAAKLFAATVRGEFSENKFEALKFAVRHIPGQNIWWAKGALEHVLLDSLQEYMSPGYTIKMDRKLEKRGQKRILPSSDLFTRTPDKTIIGGD